MRHPIQRERSHHQFRRTKRRVRGYEKGGGKAMFLTLVRGGEGDKHRVSLRERGRSTGRLVTQEGEVWGRGKENWQYE